MYRVFLGATLCFVVTAEILPGQPKEKPNIILIVADDLGYADIAFDKDSEHYTPFLSALASEGMSLTDFHTNGPVCSPTRAALMTGRYQQRCGIEDALGPESPGLPPEEVTMGEYLKREGYATAVYGKWHLGVIPQANPVRNGFDEFRGHLNSVDYNSHIGPWGNRDWWVDDKLQNEEGYNSDLIAAHAIRFINTHRDEPFFIYLPFSNIHFPWCTPDDPDFWFEGTDYYKSIETKLGPHSPDEDVTPVVRRMVNELDRSIGKIVHEVKKHRLESNTLIFFTSDNGGYIHYNGRHKGQISDNGPLRGQKGMLYEGGIRVPAIAWWPGYIQAGSSSNELMLTMDLLPTFLELASGRRPRPSLEPLDGTSMLSVLLHNKKIRSRLVFWKKGDKGAVRDGHWKLIRDRSSTELFDLSKDIGEQENLAEKEPLVVRKLTTAFAAWEKDVAKD